MIMVETAQPTKVSASLLTPSSSTSSTASSTNASLFCSTPTSMHRSFAVSANDLRLSRMVKWYVYSPTTLPKTVFQDPYFQAMCTGYPAMTAKALSTWITAEFNAFQLFLKYILGTKHKDSWGNPCCQAIHDGGTLTNKHKYQCLGLQFVGSGFNRNFVVAVCMTVSEDGTAEKVIESFDGVVIERTGMSLKQVVGTIVADGAAQKVGSLLNINSETCLMHRAEKLATSMVGDLVRSRQGALVNPFDEGKAVLGSASRKALLREYIRRPMTYRRAQTLALATKRSKS